MELRKLKIRITENCERNDRNLIDNKITIIAEKFPHIVTLRIFFEFEFFRTDPEKIAMYTEFHDEKGIIDTFDRCTFFPKFSSNMKSIIEAPNITITGFEFPHAGNYKLLFFANSLIIHVCEINVDRQF